jgi:hypothetical protein
MVDICQVRPMASRACTEIGDQLQTGLQRDLLQHPGGDLPLLVGADELVRLRVPGRQFDVEVVQPEVAQQAEDEVQQVPDLVRGLLRGDVGVRVVLGEATHPGQPVHHTGLLEPVDRAELEQS